MVIRTRIMPPGAAAVTVFPFMFIHPDYAAKPSVLVHELEHYKQQRRWAVYGLGVGLLVWFFLYLLVLPVGWNYWRKKWETEAMRAEGYLINEIQRRLRMAPWYLWWM